MQRYVIYKEKKTICFSYTMNGSTLNSLTEYKDLSITFDHQLTFGTHILNISNKASGKYGFVVRNCKHFNDIKCIKQLYISNVRCVLEYASIVWSPYYENSKYAIERVQNRFLRYLYYKETYTYDLTISKTQLRDRYNLISLEKRRTHTSM